MRDQDGPDKSSVSRREVLGAIGMGVIALPSLVSGHVAHADASDPETRVITPAERNVVEMQTFVEDCIAANKESDPQAAVKEVLARGVSDPRAMLEAVGEPSEAGLKVFHRSETLTIFAAAWTPQMNLMPHNHLMWANIGIYTGREDNILWRSEAGELEAHDVRCLFAGDVATLDRNVIHSVTNPLLRFTGGVHIYGGDFFATERTQWDPETLDEEPSNGDVIREMFRRANERNERLQKG